MSQPGPEISSREIADDEIDLVQLFQILLKRKALIIAVALIFLLIGLGYALSKKPVYEYTTTVQIGTVLDGISETPRKIGIEAPLSVRLTLEKVYLPMAINQLSDTFGRSIAIPTVKENAKSNILLIVSKGSLEDSLPLKKLHALAVSPLIDSHGKQIAISKKQYEILAQRAKLILKELEDPKIFALDENTIKGTIESVQSDLDGLDDQKTILLTQKKGLKETRKLLLDEIVQIEKNLKVSYAERGRAVSEVKDEAKAMTFLMLSSGIQKDENRLAALRERLNVALDNEEQIVEGQLADNIRQRKLKTTKVSELKSQLTQLQAQRSSEQDKQRSQIDEAENKINLYQDTVILGLVSRSSSPVGISKSFMVVFSGILGLVGGVVLAFFSEFMVKVQKHQDEPE